MVNITFLFYVRHIHIPVGAKHTRCSLEANVSCQDLLLNILKVSYLALSGLTLGLINVDTVMSSQLVLSVFILEFYIGDIAISSETNCFPPGFTPEFTKGDKQSQTSFVSGLTQQRWHSNDKPACLVRVYS